MRWVQKIRESGDTTEGRYHAYLILDDDLTLPDAAPGLHAVTPEEAWRLVATGDWKIVEKKAG